MNKLIHLLLFLAGLHSCFAQSKFNPEIEFGLSIPTGELVSKAHNQGFTGAAGVSFNVWKGLHVKPAFQYRFYLNQLDEDVSESLRIRSFLGSIGYFVVDKDAIKLKPEIGVGISSFRNIFKVTYPDGKEGIEEMMVGKDSFVDLGISCYYQRFFVKFSYQWFNAVPTFDPEIQEAVTYNPSLYKLDFIVDKPLDMNNYSIILGFRFL